MKHTYHIGASCENYPHTLSYDFCKDYKELKETFIDVYKYLVGRKPREDSVQKFLAQGYIHAKNGCVYYFWFDAD